MKVAQVFSINRFYRVLQKDILLYSRPILVAALIVLLINVFNGLTSYYYVKEWGIELLITLLLLGGFFVISFAFHELHSPSKNVMFLTLPASSMEKFLGKFILTSIGFVAGTIAIFYITNKIGQGINRVYF